MEEAKLYASARLAVFERNEFAKFSDARGAVYRRAFTRFCSTQIVFARWESFELELPRTVSAADCPGTRRALPRQGDDRFTNRSVVRCFYDSSRNDSRTRRLCEGGHYRQG